MDFPRFTDYYTTRRNVFLASQITEDLVPVASLVPGSTTKGLFRRLQGALLCLAEKVLSRVDFQWIISGVLHIKWGGDGGPFGDETLTNCCGKIYIFFETLGREKEKRGNPRRKHSVWFPSGLLCNHAFSSRGNVSIGCEIYYSGMMCGNKSEPKVIRAGMGTRVL